MNKFSTKFAKTREEQGLSFLDLSKKTGVVPSTFYRYERGINFPKHKTLKKICEIISLNYNEMAELIEMEKESNVYAGALFPDMRKIFLESYNDGYGPKMEHKLDEKAMKIELSSLDLHPIEKTFLMVINKKLRSAGLISEKEKIEKLKKPLLEKEELFHKVVTEWGYNPGPRHLLIGFEDIENDGMLTVEKENVPGEK